MDETLALVASNIDVRIRHHSAIQIAITLGSPYRTRVNGVWRSPLSGFIVGPNVGHECLSAQSTVLVVSVEAMSLRGRWMKQNLLRGEPFVLLDELADRPEVAAAIARMKTAVQVGARMEPRDLLDALGLPAVPCAGTLDARLAEAVDLLERKLQDVPTMSGLAAAVGLSERRLRQLFRSEIGVSYRRFLLWKRIRLALAALGLGRSLAEAAAEAGFSDQAHLSKVCGAMFGVSPANLSANIQFL